MGQSIADAAGFVVDDQVGVADAIDSIDAQVKANTAELRRQAELQVFDRVVFSARLEPVPGVE